MKTPCDFAEDPSRLWYGPERINRWFHGVFEGGGARAVAYPGALEAMVESRAWFRSVAGTSAGAITAAFVGAGAEAHLAKDFTVEMFGLVDRLAGLRRLLKRGGYFPGDELADWLDEQLAKQLAMIKGKAVSRPVDFQTMFRTTGIETFIVASNLSLSEQMVFSHLSTPECGVAEAAVASASTPFAFESRLLQVPANAEGQTKHHTIVDGGLWSNFPMFVYTDPAFRAQHGAHPTQIGDDEILAFLLSGKPKESIHAGPGIAFFRKGDSINAYEWSQSVSSKPVALWCRLAAPFLAVPAFLAGVFDRTDELDRGRWPAPASPCSRHAVNAVSGLFGALTPIWLASIVWLLIAGGVAWGTWSWSAILIAGGHSTWAFVIWAAVIVFVLPLLLLLLIGLIVNSFLLRPARRVLYGLSKTYMVSGGSRSWDADKPNVVALPVPDSITAVRFRDAIAHHEAIIFSARKKTKEHLHAAARLLP